MVSDFDDGLDYIPGEDGFTASAAQARAAGFGADPAVVAVYTGTPGHAARIEADAAAAVAAREAADARAAADAAIDAMLKPADPRAEQKAAIDARFDALLAAAPDRAGDIARLREEALAAVEPAAQG